MEYEHGQVLNGFPAAQKVSEEDRLALKHLSKKLASKGVRHVLIVDNLETVAYYAALDTPFLIMSFGVLQGYKETLDKVEQGVVGG